MIKHKHIDICTATGKITEFDTLEATQSLASALVQMDSGVSYEEDYALELIAQNDDLTLTDHIATSVDHTAGIVYMIIEITEEQV